MINIHAEWENGTRVAYNWANRAGNVHQLSTPVSPQRIE